MSFIPSALNLDPYLAWSVDNDGEIQLPFEEPNNFHYEFGVPPLVDGQIEPMHDPDNHYPDNRDTLPGEHLTGGSKRGNRKTKVDRLKQCPYCHKMLDSKPSSWDRHMDVHRGYKRYKCAVCDRERMTKDQVVMHCIRHHIYGSGAHPWTDSSTAYRSKAYYQYNHARA
ncbi:unnamed protein product [Rhizoctonia solani]|uniref:C2H2-type domain-containing protein n=1 Tax=Rhizoctonia solani TaxID=456999 RepID=A0A8H3HR58_9AGAM|nr:unnamed protein product [Rhizoctonia solani]